MSGRCLVTAVCDPPGELLGKAELLWPALRARFSDIAVHVTTNTHAGWFEFLEARDVPMATAAAAWDHIGLHRRRALNVGLTSSTASHLLYADPDHIMRWVERYPADLDRTLATLNAWDCLVIGRSKAAFAAAPRRLRDTEAVVNHTFALLSGFQWDVMMAARGLSRTAASLLVHTCQEDSIGNDVAWVLRCLRHGLEVGYVAADGLRYETNPVYANNCKDREDEDPAAWMLRVKAANQHIDAMRPFLRSTV